MSAAFTSQANASDVLPPDAKEQVAQALEEDAQVMSNTQLDQQLEVQPQDVQDEIISINTDVRPLALQIGLAVPILSALVGLLLSFRMTRLPDIKPSPGVEGVLGG